MMVYGKGILAMKGKTSNAECPYCGKSLQPKPTRKKMCPSCGNFVFVWKPYLVTERESRLMDWANRLEGLGVTRKDMDTHQADLASQFGFQPTVEDLVWRTLNVLIACHAAPDMARMVYGEMAGISRDRGTSPLPFLREAARLVLLNFKRNGFVRSVRVNTVNDDLVCAKCHSPAARDIPLDEALSNLLVPNECEREFGCRCSYTANVDWDHLRQS